MRLSVSDRKALQLVQEIKQLKEASDREIMSWVITRLVPRASPNLIAFFEGAGPAVIIQEHKRTRKSTGKPKRRRR